MSDKKPQNRVLIVSGLSGAGKSTAMKVLEDLGYDTVDNLPLGMAPQLAAGWADAQHAQAPDRKGLAIGVDTRTREFSAQRLDEFLGQLPQDRGFQTELLFLECEDDLLLRRFTETRRRHPMAPAGRRLRDAIAAERAAMAPIRERADQVIDTTALSIHELRLLVTGYYALSPAALTISIVSFSYRRGLPREADLVIDVRFLKNPHYVEELQPHSGLEPAVGAFIAGDPLFDEALQRFGELVHYLMQGYISEGKSYLTIAAGCTGGRHRSVFFAEKLGEYLRNSGHKAEVRHRDIEADARLTGKGSST